MSQAGACLWKVRQATPDTARETLLVLPHAGGSAQNYATWADWFPDDLRILAAQYPGRASRAREPAQADLHRIVDELLDALDGHDGPLHIFGHSMGAYVGFELCWRRQLAGRPPAVLFASGAVPPHRLQPYPAPGVEISDEHLLELMDLCKGIPDNILNSPELMGLALETLRADLELVNNYSYGEPGRRLRIPIVAFGGDRDALVSGAEIDRWRELSAAECATHLMSGEHFYYHGLMESFTATLTPYLASVHEEQKK